MASTKQPNLKINVGSDTSGFTKGMSDVKKELGAFDKTTSTAFSKLASAFGVNVQQVEKLQNAFGGLGRKIASVGTEGSAAMGQIVASAGKAATAIGAIGIGAAVTAFKLLNEEAQAFKNTVEGANIELQTQAYLSTYRQAMHDYNRTVGESMAQSESSWRVFWGKLWQNTKTTAVNIITRPQLAGAATAARSLSSSIERTAEMAERANEVAKEAADAAGIIYDLQRRQSDATRDWADQEKLIAEYRRQAIDPELSAAQRLEALSKAEELIRKKKAEQYDLQLMISDMTDLINSKSSSSVEAVDAANKAYVEAINNLSAMEQELKSINKQQATLTGQVQKEAAARKETADAIALGVSRMQEYATAQIDMFVSDESVTAIQNFLGGAFATKPVEVPVQLQTESVEQQLLELGDVVHSTLVEGIEGIAEAFGNLIANLTTGEGGMAEFGQDMLTMFGTFAQKFGKVLIAFGVAVEAAKMAGKTFNGIAAIVAGAALVAAGAAVKAIASNMASSMGAAATSSSYVASSAMGGSTGYNDRTLQVEVTGTLTANGSQLVAVLNNENNRKQYTT